MISEKAIKQWAVKLDFVNGSSVDLTTERLEELVGILYSDLAWDIVPSTKETIGEIQLTISVLCLQLGVDVNECKELAFNKYKNCKGKMVDGSYVEEER